MVFSTKRSPQQRPQPTVALAAILLAASNPSPLLPAQEPAPTAPDRHESSLGYQFVTVPGTMVLFATTEVRLADFKRFIADTKYPWTFTPHFAQADDHPVVGVNLQDALAFCNWLTETERGTGKLNNAQLYRLPSDREWGAAAGIVLLRKQGELTPEETLADQKRFPWGTTWPPPAGAANLAEDDIPDFTDTYVYTAPVGKFKPTADGLFDLAGNAWEWTQDSDLRAKPTGRLRGGSWAYFNPVTLMSAYIYEVPIETRAATIGFRMVYEDRQRTAALLASADTQRQNQLVEKREEMIAASQTNASTVEIEAMRRRLAGGSNPDAALPAPKTLQPPARQQPFMNTTGMTLLPLPQGSVLIAETLVTAGQYELFLQAKSHTWTDKPSHIASPEHPAAGLSWERATEFCTWLTETERATGLLPEGARYRLLSDVEWSAAAGLDDESGLDPEARHLATPDHFPWSPPRWPPPVGAANLDATKIAGFDDAFAYTSPVKATSPTERGFYDLAGNLAEWCADPWPSQPDHRVYRGGSWLSSAQEDLLTSRRHHAPASAARDNIGFRYALDLP